MATGACLEPPRFTGLEAVEDILWYGADLTAEVDAPSPQVPPVVALPAPSPVPLPGPTARVPEPARPSPEP